MKFGRMGIFGTFLVGLSLAAASGVHAGAWVQPRHKLFMSLQTYYYETDHYFTDSGHRRDRGGDFRKWEFNPYLEYGLTERDTLVGNFFYDWLSDDASGKKKKTQGLADLELGWKHLVAHRDPYVFSVQGTLIVPTGYDIDDDPRLGYGRLGAEGSVLLGRYFKLADRYGYIDTSLGYRYYLGYPGSQVRSTLSIGYDIVKPIQLMATAELQYGLNDGDDKAVGPNLIVEPDYRLLKLTLAARWRITEYYSVVGAWYAHAWGENTGGDGGFYVSLWLKL